MQIVNPTTYLVNVNNHIRFVHIDYLRARWASCAGSSFPDVPTPAPSSTSEPASDGTTASQLPRLELTPSELPVPEQTQRDSDSAPTQEPAPPLPQLHGEDIRPDGVSPEDSRQAPLRRGSRTRRAPDRYEAQDFKPSRLDCFLDIKCMCFYLRVEGMLYLKVLGLVEMADVMPAAVDIKRR